jgi:hypothetical protein
MGETQEYLSAIPYHLYRQRVILLAKIKDLLLAYVNPHQLLLSLVLVAIQPVLATSTR